MEQSNIHNFPIFTAMPQDSVDIASQSIDTAYAKPTDSISYSISYTTVEREAKEKTIDQAWAAFWVSTVIASFFLLRHLYLRGSSRFFAGRLLESIPPETYARYGAILEQFNPYYRKLSPDLRYRFLQRTIKFMNGKQFHYIELAAEERIPLLISSVTVQITFGLDQYKMDFFSNIYVLRTNYHFGLSHIPYEGHVNRLGIYLSWNNFETAFTDYSDGNNVGLHEMAHALAYINFTVRQGEDNHFRKQFKSFSKVGRKLFGEMQNGKVTMLGKYASTNYNEFWAVCIENYFERPLAMKNELPELYSELVNLLKQDPLSDNLLINKVD